MTLLAESIRSLRKELDTRIVDKSRDSIDPQAIIKEKLVEAYGNRIKVDFLDTRFEESKDGGRFWAVEGNFSIKKMFIWKKAYHFLYCIDEKTGKVAIMRGRRV